MLQFTNIKKLLSVYSWKKMNQSSKCILNCISTKCWSKIQKLLMNNMLKLDTLCVQVLYVPQLDFCSLVIN
jgi:hypothetical protein